MKVYFDYPENATQARTELVSMGVPRDAMKLEIHKGGDNPVRGVRRAMGDPSTEATHGATIIIADEADWLLNTKVMEVARHHNGRVRT
jgi:hypothetical protein